MPYRCVHCSATYDDRAEALLTGCKECRGKFFFYIREEKLKEIEQVKEQELLLEPEEKQQIEKDVREISGITDEEVPVFLDFESISIVKSGKYLIDLPKLFSKDKPRVYRLEDGKYIVDLSAQVNTKRKLEP
jgi:predicted  nucleic acid-binding Zn-ribbon protein